MKIKFSRFLVVFLGAAFLCLLAGTQIVFAQQQQRNPINTYAITNARIVTGAGADIERGTIIIRNGLILAVGAGNLQLPLDARVVDGTGLTVYPGIFDASASVGIPIAQRPTQPTGTTVFFGMPPQQPQTQSNSAYPAGLQPETAAADLIRPTDASFESARNNGFTTALVVPRERVFQGQSALVNLAGEAAADSIVRAPVALHVAFAPLQTGQYPTALMGTFAAVRQMFLDAQQLQTAQRNYEKNPVGARRPEANKSLEAIFPALNRTMPVVFQADTEREILRALSFAAEFNLRPVIAGGGEAHRVAERLKTQNVPVLLSLNFPRRTAAGSAEADPESLRILRYRVETPKTAGRLAAAKVPFAFQSGGAANPADFWTNAARAVENGLSRQDAIRAMTANAATIFGVADRMGTIEPNKIANLTVTRGDIFDKNRAFTHVFVDGQMFEIRQPARPAAGAAQPGTGTVPAGTQNVAGTWDLTVEIPGQKAQATLILQQQGNQLSGTLQSPLGNAEISRGEITAEGFRFSTKLTIGELVDVIFNGRVTGNQMTGTVTSPQGTANFSGARTTP